jgi:cobalt-zinc-cadmium efflux system protein
MAHHHHNTGKNLGLTILLNLFITVAQVIGGIISGSMALLSDAAHNFSDVLSLIISWVAKRLSGKTRTLAQTYGYKRAEIFAAFVNSTTLIVIAGIIIKEAIERFFHPVEVQGNLVIYLAALSILINGLSVLLVKKDAKESMNIRSAYLHLFTDMLTSIAVLIGGLVIKYLGWTWIDSTLSLLIAIFLIYSSWTIFKDSLKILMQFTPSTIDIEKIATKLQSISGVKNLHHIHVWQLDEHEIIFEAHVDVEDDILISSFEKILNDAGEILSKFQIHHFNLQPELNMKDDKDLINVKS